MNSSNGGREFSAQHGEGRGEAARASAVSGASQAYSKPPLKPKPIINTYSGSNGALAAATKAQGNSSKLQIQDTDEPPREKSPSSIAATLAAARSTPQVAARADSSPERQLSTIDPDIQTAMAPSSAQKEASWPETGTDSTSIAPTSSLIGLFEQTNAGGVTKKLPGSFSSSTAPSLHAPTPLYPLQRGSASLAAAILASSSPSPAITQRGPALEDKRNETVLDYVPRGTSIQASAKYSGEPPVTSKIPPKVPPTRRMRPVEINQPLSQKQSTNSETSSVTSFKSAPEYAPVPTPPPARRPKKSAAAEEPEKAKLSAPSSAFQPEPLRPTARRLPPQLTGESLADAIIASSLASSRAPSPSKTQAPALPRRRRSRSHHLLPHRQSIDARSVSPPKGLRHTMRKPVKSDDEDEKMKPKQTKNFLNKHPNKHREGDRKRWRDEITDLERKRYEGVWAANKGLYLFMDPPSSRGDILLSQEVLSVVARDIWLRSRLPQETLQEVWSLVDQRGIGALTREEFVVGMWLIDQQLKGRKLPMRVSPSVWESVRNFRGVKIPANKTTGK